MNTEIAPRDWEEFCRRFTEVEHGEAITLEFRWPDGRLREEPRTLQLESLRFEKEPGCSDVIWLRGQDVDLRLLEPIRMWLKQNPEGGYNPLQIEAEEGSVVLHLRPALKPTVLEGLHGPANLPARA